MTRGHEDMHRNLKLEILAAPISSGSIFLGASLWLSKNVQIPPSFNTFTPLKKDR